MWYRCTWEGNRQPKERASQQIKGIGPDKICTQVGGPAPTQIAASDRIMTHLIKRNLLHIKIAIE